jgi:hypothetical protein
MALLDFTVEDLCDMVEKPTPEEMKLVKDAWSTGMKKNIFSDAKVARLKEAFCLDASEVEMMLHGKIFIVVIKGERDGPWLALDVQGDEDTWASVIGGLPQ